MHCSTISFVTIVFSLVNSPLFIAISSVLSAVLASPFENNAIAYTSSSAISTLSIPKPFLSFKALVKSLAISSVVSCFNTNTLHLESKAAFISKEGFSVVAPIRIILPLSTKGRKASCCALLKR